MIKSILLPIDGSNYSEAVLRYGQYLAEIFGSVLRVLTVVDIRLFDWSMAAGADSFVPIMPSAEFQEESQAMLDERAQKVIERASTILKNCQQPFELLKVSGIPVDEICYHAKTNDIVIMGKRGEYEKWTSKLLGATVEAVTRQVSKPTLLVDKNFSAFKKIICGYDGSSTAVKALQLAAHMTSEMNVPLQVISIFDSEEERKVVLQEAEKYLKPYDIEFTLRHESGDVSEVLVQAQKNSDTPTLVVIGSYGHSRLREAILGSTTVDLMRKATQPVLLAK